MNPQDMKLESTKEKILPYLSHRLMCQTVSQVGHVATWEIEGFKSDAVHLKGSPYMCDISDIKPLLVPLVALRLEHAQNCGYSRLGTFIADIKSRRVAVIWWDDLLNNHYDVFDLIDNGLALNKLTHEK